MSKIYKLKYIYPATEQVYGMCTVNTKTIVYDGLCGIELRNIDKIQWYETYIDSQNTNNQQFKNALIGSFIAGSTGAIIASAFKNNIQKPCQCMEVFYYDDNQIKIIVLADVFIKSQVSECLYSLKDVLVQYNINVNYKKINFENSFMFRKNNNNIINNSKQNNNSEQNDIPTQIKQLAELKKQGILTDEEFTSKKQELLARL
ncbi:hypothetical protein HMPREF9629_00865 [Peptoanaerobacter stomatis]|uniref:SHOCT domain-containing protein n=1 Tax=Peptoanaerobacter stomatis TaxID=796937 RepID=G9X3A8_9FIRM|nr:SHOCT domain-containing protein [Peptoanaerobacter stomatis]EHL10650.1 hypothetical protein HMPREF9629_00865 [Peptoanaerobacter stomatis]